MSARRRHRRIVRTLAGASALGWGVLLLADVSPVLPRLCSASGWSMTAHALAAARFNPLLLLALAYLGMLGAMMAPLLALPLREISDRSVPRARTAAMGLFALAYALPWLLAAPLFGLAVVGLETGFGPGSLWPRLLPAALALGWHLTPLRQGALNRCHRRIAGFFGYRGGYRALAGQGLGQGAACLAACAPLMLWATAQQGWHLPAMALVAAFLWVERRLPPETPLWGPANLRRTGERFAHFAGHSLIRAKLALAPGRAARG